MKPLLATLLALCLAAPAPARAADPTGTLVLYTSQPDKVAAETVRAFEKTSPGVTVKVYRSGTTQVMNKLAAEFLAGAPQPDVLLIADSMSMQALKQQGRLLPDPTVSVAGFPEGSYDPDRTYFGTKLITTGIAYNTHAPFVPRNWADLTKPAAKGEVVMPDPLYSGAAMITLGSFAQDKSLGFGFYEALAKDGATTSPGNGGVLRAVASGQKMFGMVVDFMALNAAAKGSPVRFVFPADGVTAVTEPVAILKTAHNIAAARAFVAFLLSRQGQELAARQGFLPAMRGVTPPPSFPAKLDLKLMPLDVAALLAHQDALKQRFTALFGG